MDTTELKKRAYTTHGSKYSYVDTVYTNARDKVTIRCKVHGDFTQLPHQHLVGKGCQKCGVLQRAKSASKTTEQFIADAQRVHGTTYTYDNTIYVNGLLPVIITCTKHGDFTKVPTTHINGKSGCNKCTHIQVANKARLTLQRFKETSTKLHECAYDYSKVEIGKSSKDKVKIICKVHGEFKQSAQSHMSGHGCPKCAKKGFDKLMPGLVYYVRVTKGNKEYYKIGITNKSVNDRFKSEKCKIDKVLTLEFDLGYDAFLLEQHIIRDNLEYLYTGSLILNSGGNTELFTKDILKGELNEPITSK